MKLVANVMTFCSTDNYNYHFKCFLSIRSTKILFRVGRDSIENLLAQENNGA